MFPEIDTSNESYEYSFLYIHIIILCLVFASDFPGTVVKMNKFQDLPPRNMQRQEGSKAGKSCWIQMSRTGHLLGTHPVTRAGLARRISHGRTEMGEPCGSHIWSSACGLFHQLDAPAGAFPGLLGTPRHPCSQSFLLGDASAKVIFHEGRPCEQPAPHPFHKEAALDTDARLGSHQGRQTDMEALCLCLHESSFL